MMKAGQSTSNFATNHRYSVAALTDSTGAVVERYMYDGGGGCCRGLASQEAEQEQGPAMPMPCQGGVNRASRRSDRAGARPLSGAVRRGMRNAWSRLRMTSPGVWLFRCWRRLLLDRYTVYRHIDRFADDAQLA